MDAPLRPHGQARGRSRCCSPRRLPSRLRSKSPTTNKVRFSASFFTSSSFRVPDEPRSAFMLELGEGAGPVACPSVAACRLSRRWAAQPPRRRPGQGPGIRGLRSVPEPAATHRRDLRGREDRHPGLSAVGTLSSHCSRAAGPMGVRVRPCQFSADVSVLARAVDEGVGFSIDLSGGSGWRRGREVRAWGWTGCAGWCSPPG
jgi:hypothetical protein